MQLAVPSNLIDEEMVKIAPFSVEQLMTLLTNETGAEVSCYSVIDSDDTDTKFTYYKVGFWFELPTKESMGQGMTAWGDSMLEAFREAYKMWIAVRYMKAQVAKMAVEQAAQAVPQKPPEETV